MYRVSHLGFTLVELITTLIIISLAALAITNTLSFAFRHQSDGLWQTQSLTLADTYLQEILARRYDEFTPVGGIPACSPSTTPCSSIGLEGEIRQTFDDVDDFHGLDEAPPLDVFGNPLVEYGGYRVQVAIAYLTPAEVTDLALDDPTDAKRVTVTVTPPSRSPLSISSLVANF